MAYGIGVFVVSAIITHFIESKTPSVLKQN